MYEMFLGIVANEIFIIGFVAWFFAQLLKVIIHMVVQKQLNLERFYGSGGMPSAHSASIMGVTSAIGMTEGYDSSLFALALMIALIVMYDASGVRRSVGKQAKLLNSIILDVYKHKYVEQEKLKELVGHKPIEVAMGAILGLIVARLMI